MARTEEQIGTIIANALGKLQDWAWEGGYNYVDPEPNTGADQPKCICGKALVHVYIIVNQVTNETAIVGLECVKRFRKAGSALVWRWNPSRMRAR